MTSGKQVYSTRKKVHREKMDGWRLCLQLQTTNTGFGLLLLLILH